MSAAGHVTTAPTHAGDPASTVTEELEVAVVPSSVLSVLATIRSAKGQSSFFLALPTQNTPPVEHVTMEISASSEEVEAPRPKDNVRAVAPFSTIIDVD